MSASFQLSVKAKIRSRLSIIEKNISKYLKQDKINRTKEHIQKQLNVLKNSDLKTGILKPNFFTENIFKKNEN